MKDVSPEGQDKLLAGLIKPCEQLGISFLLITRDSNGLYSMSSTDSKLLELLDASNPVCRRMAPQIGLDLSHEGLQHEIENHQASFRQTDDSHGIAASQDQASNETL